VQVRSDQSFALGVILLAAGRSRRMGQPKLLLPWDDTTVLGHLLRQWRELRPSQIAVVVAADASALANELDRLAFPQDQRIYNPDPEQGMFSSVQCAVAWPHWRVDLTHWLITLGDQPQLRPATLRELIDFALEHPEAICQPLRNGRRRHPVVLPRRIFLELQTTAKPDLKAFLADHTADCAGFECSDPGLDADMDTPEDYDRLKPK
jgi:molybdenum cofactor cytidylyltransferase